MKKIASLFLVLSLSPSFHAHPLSGAAADEISRKLNATIVRFNATATLCASLTAAANLLTTPQPALVAEAKQWEAQTFINDPTITRQANYPISSYLQSIYTNIAYVRDTETAAMQTAVQKVISLVDTRYLTVLKIAATIAHKALQEVNATLQTTIDAPTHESTSSRDAVRLKDTAATASLPGTQVLGALAASNYTLLTTATAPTATEIAKIQTDISTFFQNYQTILDSVNGVVLIQARAAATATITSALQSLATLKEGVAPADTTARAAYTASLGLDAQRTPSKQKLTAAAATAVNDPALTAAAGTRAAAISVTDTPSGTAEQLAYIQAKTAILTPLAQTCTTLNACTAAAATARAIAQTATQQTTTTALTAARNVAAAFVVEAQAKVAELEAYRSFIYAADRQLLPVNVRDIPAGPTVSVTLSTGAKTVTGDASSLTTQKSTVLSLNSSEAIADALITATALNTAFNLLLATACTLKAALIAKDLDTQAQVLLTTVADNQTVTTNLARLKNSIQAALTAIQADYTQLCAPNVSQAALTNALGHAATIITTEQATRLSLLTLKTNYVVSLARSQIDQAVGEAQKAHTDAAELVRQTQSFNLNNLTLKQLYDRARALQSDPTGGTQHLVNTLTTSQRTLSSLSPTQVYTTTALANIDLTKATTAQAVVTETKRITTTVTGSIRELSASIQSATASLTEQAIAAARELFQKTSNDLAQALPLAQARETQAQKALSRAKLLDTQAAGTQQLLARAQSIATNTTALLTSLQRYQELYPQNSPAPSYATAAHAQEALTAAQEADRCALSVTNDSAMPSSREITQTAEAVDTALLTTTRTTVQKTVARIAAATEAITALDASAQRALTAVASSPEAVARIQLLRNNASATPPTGTQVLVAELAKLSTQFPPSATTRSYTSAELAQEDLQAALTAYSSAQSSIASAQTLQAALSEIVDPVMLQGSATSATQALQAARTTENSLATLTQSALALAQDLPATCSQKEALVAQVRSFMDPIRVVVASTQTTASVTIPDAAEYIKNTLSSLPSLTTPQLTTVQNAAAAINPVYETQQKKLTVLSALCVATAADQKILDAAAATSIESIKTATLALRESRDKDVAKGTLTVLNNIKEAYQSSSVDAETLTRAASLVAAKQELMSSLDAALARVNGNLLEQHTTEARTRIAAAAAALSAYKPLITSIDSSARFILVGAQALSGTLTPSKAALITSVQNILESPSSSGTIPSTTQAIMQYLSDAQKALPTTPQTYTTSDEALKASSIAQAVVTMIEAFKKQHTALEASVLTATRDTARATLLEAQSIANDADIQAQSAATASTALETPGAVTSALQTQSQALKNQLSSRITLTSGNQTNVLTVVYKDYTTSKLAAISTLSLGESQVVQVLAGAVRSMCDTKKVLATMLTARSIAENADQKVVKLMAQAPTDQLKAGAAALRTNTVTEGTPGTQTTSTQLDSAIKKLNTSAADRAAALELAKTIITNKDKVLAAINSYASRVTGAAQLTTALAGASRAQQEALESITKALPLAQTADAAALKAIEQVQSLDSGVSQKSTLLTQAQALQNNTSTNPPTGTAATVSYLATAQKSVADAQKVYESPTDAAIAQQNAATAKSFADQVIQKNTALLASIQAVVTATNEAREAFTTQQAVQDATKVTQGAVDAALEKAKGVLPLAQEADTAAQKAVADIRALPSGTLDASSLLTQAVALAQDSTTGTATTLAYIINSQKELSSTPKTFSSSAQTQTTREKAADIKTKLEAIERTHTTVMQSITRLAEQTKNLQSLAEITATTNNSIAALEPLLKTAQATAASTNTRAQKVIDAALALPSSVENKDDLVAQARALQNDGKNPPSGTKVDLDAVTTTTIPLTAQTFSTLAAAQEMAKKVSDVMVYAKRIQDNLAPTLAAIQKLANTVAAATTKK